MLRINGHKKSIAEAHKMVILSPRGSKRFFASFLSLILTIQLCPILPEARASSQVPFEDDPTQNPAGYSSSQLAQRQASAEDAITAKNEQIDPSTTPVAAPDEAIPATEPAEPPADESEVIDAEADPLEPDTDQLPEGVQNVQNQLSAAGLNATITASSAGLYQMDVKRTGGYAAEVGIFTNFKCLLDSNGNPVFDSSSLAAFNGIAVNAELIYKGMELLGQKYPSYAAQHPIVRMLYINVESANSDGCIRLAYQNKKWLLYRDSNGQARLLERIPLAGTVQVPPVSTAPNSPANLSFTVDKESIATVTYNNVRYFGTYNSQTNKITLVVSDSEQWSIQLTWSYSRKAYYIQSFEQNANNGLSKTTYSYFDNGQLTQRASRFESGATVSYQTTTYTMQGTVLKINSSVNEVVNKQGQRLSITKYYYHYMYSNQTPAITMVCYESGVYSYAYYEHTEATKKTVVSVSGQNLAIADKIQSAWAGRAVIDSVAFTKTELFGYNAAGTYSSSIVYSKNAAGVFTPRLRWDSTGYAIVQTLPTGETKYLPIQQYQAVGDYTVFFGDASSFLGKPGYGLIFYKQDLSGAWKTGFIENFPAENKVTLDGKLYKVTLDAKGKVLLTVCTIPFALSASTNMDGLKNLTVSVDEDNQAVVKWYSQEYKGVYDPTTDCVTVSPYAGSAWVIQIATENGVQSIGSLEQRYTSANYNYRYKTYFSVDGRMSKTVYVYWTPDGQRYDYVTDYVMTAIGTQPISTRSESRLNDKLVSTSKEFLSYDARGNNILDAYVYATTDKDGNTTYGLSSYRMNGACVIYLHGDRMSANVFDLVQSAADVKLLDDVAPYREEDYFKDETQSEYVYSMYFGRNAAGQMVARYYQTADGQTAIVVGEPDLLTSERDDIQIAYGAVNGYSVYYGETSYLTGIQGSYGLIFNKGEYANGQWKSTSVVVDYPSEKHVTLDGVKHKISIADGGKVQLSACMQPVELALSTELNQLINVHLSIDEDGNATASYDGLEGQGVFNPDTNQIIMDPNAYNHWVIQLEKNGEGYFLSSFERVQQQGQWIMTDYLNSQGTITRCVLVTDYGYGRRTQDQTYRWGTDGTLKYDTTIDQTEVNGQITRISKKFATPDAVIIGQGWMGPRLVDNYVEVSKTLNADGTYSCSAFYSMIENNTVRTSVSINDSIVDFTYFISDAGMFAMLDQYAQRKQTDYGHLDKVFYSDYTVVSYRDGTGKFVERYAFDYATWTSYLIQGKPDRISGETDDIKYQAYQYVLGNSYMLLDYGLAPKYEGYEVTGDAYGLIFQSMTANKYVVVDYPNKKTVTLDGKTYKISIDQDGIISLDLFPVGTYSVQADLITSAVQVVATFDENGTLKVTLEGNPFAATYDPSTGQIKFDVSGYNTLCHYTLQLSNEGEGFFATSLSKVYTANFEDVTYYYEKALNGVRIRESVSIPKTTGNQNIEVIYSRNLFGYNSAGKVISILNVSQMIDHKTGATSIYDATYKIITALGTATFYIARNVPESLNASIKTVEGGAQLLANLANEELQYVCSATDTASMLTVMLYPPKYPTSGNNVNGIKYYVRDLTTGNYVLRFALAQNFQGSIITRDASNQEVWTTFKQNQYITVSGIRYQVSFGFSYDIMGRTSDPNRMGLYLVDYYGPDYYMDYSFLNNTITINGKVYKVSFDAQGNIILT